MHSTTTIAAPRSDLDATTLRLASPREPSTRTGSDARSTTGSRDAGLCVNCALRDACRFPVPQGGVWHCEEYA